MSIPFLAKPTPIDSPNISFPAVDPETGLYTPQELRRQNKLRNYVVGMGRIIPCLCASSSNLLTLTPNGSGAEDGESPLIEGYRFGDMFLFVADANSTGAVTATVVPKSGTLATIKVYINGGASQAGAGDVSADRVYLGVFAYNVDGGNGGLVIRHP